MREHLERVLVGRLAASRSLVVGLGVAFLLVGTFAGFGRPTGAGPGRLSGIGPGRAAAQAGGFRRELQLRHGAFAPPGVPNAVVHAGPAFRATGPIDLVVFLHGFRGCARAQVASRAQACGGAKSVPGRHLGRVHAEAGTNTLLVVPQLKLLKRDGSPGRFGRVDGFAAFVGELLDEALVEELGPGGRGRLRRIVLVAHSAGYQAALAILDRGGLPDLVRDVVLLDALYAGAPGFAGWLMGSEQRRLISLHAGRGKPARFSRVLARRFSRAGLARANLAQRLSDPKPEPTPVPPFRWAVERLPTAHAWFPKVHLAGLLQVLLAVDSRTSG